MKITIARKLGPALGPVVLLFLAVTPVSARSLDFEQTPVTDATAQIDRAFGANIVIEDGIDVNRLVTFSVTDIEGDGARLEAVSSLANALGADYYKVFLVSKIADGSTPPNPGIDVTDAPVVPPNAQMPAEDAIKLVAGIDDAVAQFYSPITASVTFPGAQLTAGPAAADIARQTHTVWKAFYYLVSRAKRRVPAGSEIVGYTAGGQPITELSGESFLNSDSSTSDDTAGQPAAALPEAGNSPGVPAETPGQNNASAGSMQPGQPAGSQYTIQVPAPVVFGAQNPNGFVVGSPSYGPWNGFFSYTGPYTSTQGSAAGGNQPVALSPGFTTNNGALSLLPNFGGGSAFGSPLTLP